MLTELDHYLFGQGTHYEIYDKLGAHPLPEGGFSFAVWAPHARSVSVVGDFNGWDGGADPLTRSDGGIWEGSIGHAQSGQNYKYNIQTADGRWLMKADPYASWAEYRPGTASRLFASQYTFHDKDWMRRRADTDPYTSPLSIYEVQLASWERDVYGGNAFLNYRLLAEKLSAYVQEMGYTHVELIGLAEYPLDASWGYQVTGYYAPTARHGSPDDFRAFVDVMHQHGIGVIVDWVPAHFPRDAHGLADFDGEALYEHPDPRRGEHPDWGTKIFDWGRHEVSNFLIGSALNWLENFHVDGLRVDAVASMLYLDYGRRDGEWVPNIYGGKENLEAIEFLKHMNSIVHRRVPGVITVAEESTAWPGVTASPEDGGLGFDFKWNMGWMHDFLDYMQKDPIYRSYHHNQMTFSMTYANSENYILAISHDEVVHLKRSLWSKMPGYDEDKARSLKCALTYMIGHPGKKLLFMGQEFGQEREWCEDRELDWYLLGDARHREVQRYFRQLLRLYRSQPALFERDRGFEGFEWINCDDASRSILSFLRYSAGRRDMLVFVTNFTPCWRDDYCVGVPQGGRYELLLASEGSHERDAKEHPVFTAEESPCDGKPFRINYPLPGYGTAIFRRLED